MSKSPAVPSTLGASFTMSQLRSFTWLRLHVFTVQEYYIQCHGSCDFVFKLRLLKAQFAGPRGLSGVLDPAQS